jgi:hypothetical protein
MRFPALSAALAGLLIVCATAPSSALCLLCNASVRLDPGLAACFAERAGDELKTLTASGKDFIIVDLKDCASRGGLPTGQSSPVPLDTAFAIDASGLKCLSDQIAALDDTKLTPSHLFDLAKDCPAQ